MEENVINTIDSLNLEEGLPLITNLIMKGIIDIRFIVSNEGNGIFILRGYSQISIIIK